MESGLCQVANNSSSVSCKDIYLSYPFFAIVRVLVILTSSRLVTSALLRFKDKLRGISSECVLFPVYQWNQWDLAVLTDHLLFERTYGIGNLVLEEGNLQRRKQGKKKSANSKT